jgi:FlaA1/EpsC-like NDP-sugar epimerase
MTDLIQGTSRQITKSKYGTSCFTNPIWYSLILTVVVLVLGYIIFKQHLDVKTGCVFKFAFYTFILVLLLQMIFKHTLQKYITDEQDKDHKHTMAMQLGNTLGGAKVTPRLRSDDLPVAPVVKPSEPLERPEPSEQHEPLELPLALPEHLSDTKSPYVKSSSVEPHSMVEYS